jgi:hypothetical protein
MKILILVITLGLACFAQSAHYRHHGKTALPDETVTHGSVNNSCVADLSGKKHMVKGIEENICASNFRTGPIRAQIRNFKKRKQQACDLYGVKKCDASVEGDHLISIEVCGCPDCLINLWPQPMDEAREKDHQVEDVLPKLICAGKISLKAAQRCIADDWVECEKKIQELK